MDNFSHGENISQDYYKPFLEFVYYQYYLYGLTMTSSIAVLSMKCIRIEMEEESKDTRMTNNTGVQQTVAEDEKQMGCLSREWWILVLIL